MSPFEKITIRIFLFISKYFYLVLLKDLIITNRDDDNVIGVNDISQIIFCLSYMVQVRIIIRFHLKANWH